MIRDYAPFVLIPIALVLIFIAPLLPIFATKKRVGGEDIKPLFKLRKEKTTPILWLSCFFMIFGLVLNVCDQQIIGTCLVFFSMLLICRFSRLSIKNVGE